VPVTLDQSGYTSREVPDLYMKSLRPLEMETARATFDTLTRAGGYFGVGAATGYFAPIVGAIIAIAIVAIVVFAIIAARKTHPTAFTKGPIDLFQPTNPVIVSRSDIQKVMAGSYTLSFYLQVSAVPDMRATATPLITWPGVWNLAYQPANETLQWTFEQTADSAAPATVDTLMVPGVTLQRWNQIVIAVEGRSVDVYINGAIAVSTILKNLPPAAAASITVVPGEIRGQLAYAQAWPRRLSTGEVGANYADTSDSQGRPMLGPTLWAGLPAMPSVGCPSGDCGTQPTASKSQTWEFPYQ
jgi:hypothetical protein